MSSYTKPQNYSFTRNIFLTATRCLHCYSHVVRTDLRTTGLCNVLRTQCWACQSTSKLIIHFIRRWILKSKLWTFYVLVRRSGDMICFRCYIPKCWNTEKVSTTSHFYEKIQGNIIGDAWWIFPMILYVCIYKKREVYIKLVSYGNLWNSCTHNRNSRLFLSPQINPENICFSYRKRLSH